MLGEIPILTNIFQMGWNHQLEVIFRFNMINFRGIYLEPQWPQQFLKGQLRKKKKQGRTSKSKAEGHFGF